MQAPRLQNEHNAENRRSAQDLATAISLGVSIFAFASVEIKNMHVLILNMSRSVANGEMFWFRSEAYQITAKLCKCFFPDTLNKTY